jgi:hypothetical protein
LATVLEELPEELRPKPDNYFYKKHSDHAGFKAPEAGPSSSPIEEPKAWDSAVVKKGFESIEVVGIYVSFTA